MAKFKIIISNPKENTVQIVELEGPAAQPLISREIGELVDGNIVGLSGKKLKITGGTDKDGIPMRKDVSGGGKKRILLSGGIGFKPQPIYKIIFIFL